MQLEYFPPSSMSSDIPLVKLPSDVVDECAAYWRNTLVKLPSSIFFFGSPEYCNTNVATPWAS